MGSLRDILLEYYQFRTYIEITAAVFQCDSPLKSGGPADFWLEKRDYCICELFGMSQLI